MSDNDFHESHPRVLRRLKRAEGQLRSIQAMIEAGRPCLEVAQQMQAAASAVRAAQKEFINDHLDHCLDKVLSAKGRDAQMQLDEFKAVTKYL